MQVPSSTVSTPEHIAIRQSINCSSRSRIFPKRQVLLSQDIKQNLSARQDSTKQYLSVNYPGSNEASGSSYTPIVPKLNSHVSTVPTNNITNEYINTLSGKGLKRKQGGSNRNIHHEALQSTIKNIHQQKENLNESIVARVNIICKQFSRLPEEKQGLAFINIMSVFKKFIKRSDN